MHTLSYCSRFSVHRQTVLLHNIEGFAEEKTPAVTHVTTIRNNLAVLSLLERILEVF